MRKKDKGPTIPPERHDTIRHEIASLLIGKMMSAREISALVKISEKDVFDHLVHIQRSHEKTGHRLRVHPAECVNCGFTFTKRERLNKPSRCPVCKGESILDPLFTVEP